MSNVIEISTILQARTAKDLFGQENDKHAKKIYNRLLQASHPDMFTSVEDKKVAQKAFIKLNELWNSLQKPNTKKNTIVTKKHTYELQDVTADNNGFIVYTATYDAGHKEANLIFPKDAEDNDLNETQVEHLKLIKKEVKEEFKWFYPKIIDNFRFTINGTQRNFLATEKLEGFYTLKQVKEDYPEGINAKDIAWIFRRILVALGNIHDIGLVHGGINLDSIIIHPELHGLALTDWQYSVETGNKLTAIPNDYKNFYPEYVFNKASVSKDLDFWLAAKTMEDLLDSKAPKQLKLFLKGCQLDRMPDAIDLLAEFDALLATLWGPKKFHEFKMKRKN